MSVSAIIILVAVAALTLGYALWEFGADGLVARFGRAVVRTITLGRVRLSPHVDDSTAIGVATLTVVGLFMVVLLLAAGVP